MQEGQGRSLSFCWYQCGGKTAMTATRTTSSPFTHVPQLVGILACRCIKETMHIFVYPFQVGT